MAKILKMLQEFGEWGEASIEIKSDYNSFM